MEKETKNPEEETTESDEEYEKFCEDFNKVVIDATNALRESLVPFVSRIRELAEKLDGEERRKMLPDFLGSVTALLLVTMASAGVKGKFFPSPVSGFGEILGETVSCAMRLTEEKKEEDPK